MKNLNILFKASDMFLDLSDFVHFVPGTIMTIISSFAIITSFYAFFKLKKSTSLVNS